MDQNTPNQPVNHGYYKTRIAVIGIICIVLGAFLWAALSETVLKLKTPAKNQTVKAEVPANPTNQPATGNSQGSTPQPSQPVQPGQTTPSTGTGTPSGSTGSSVPGSGTPSTPAPTPSTPPTSPATNTPGSAGGSGPRPLTEASSTPVLIPSPSQPSRPDSNPIPPSRTGVDPSASGTIGL